MSFGDKIKKLRKELGLSQADFGKTIGVSGTTISQYESEQRFPDHETFVRICKFFNVSSDYLLGLSDIKSPSLKEGGMVIDCKNCSSEQLETLRLFVRAFIK